jgi:hypothetical protein
VRFHTVVFALALVLLLGAPCLVARQADRWCATSHTLANIYDAEARGLLSHDEGALNRVYYVFDRSRVDPRFLVEGETPGKDATLLIHSILEDGSVGEPVKAVLREFLGRPFESREEYISPSGIFKLTYYTTGPDAVPVADDNGNGVPDYVEWCGDYMDTSWQTEITDLGFMAPALVGGYYHVGFEAMSYYGYCTIWSGSTRIVLHRNFLGFPENDDPEGDQKGAAKVTCSHEFKHASQYTNSHWSEGGWVEVDSTWMEDIVFPQVNDYFNFVDVYGSPLNNPELSLDDGGSGSYDDCLWQHYMSGTWGNQLIVDLWDLRHDYPGWTMLQSYEAALNAYGSSVPEVMAAWTRWNYLTGDRGVHGYGYDDAIGLNTAVTWVSTSGLGTPATGSVPHLATRYARHISLLGLPDHPKVIFDGSNGIDFRPQIIAKLRNGTVLFDTIALDALSDGEKVLSVPFSDCREIGLSFPYCQTVGSSRTFTYELTTDPGTGVDETAGGRVRLLPVSPNPFNPTATIRFELPSPRVVHLSVVTPSGRVVRELAGGRVWGAGPHEIVFDGRDEAGNELASGLYFVQLNAGGTETHLAKVTLLK